MTKYSDLLADWLAELGYTHCFFVAGGNIMHLLESCSRKLTCIPVVHEVAAGIAAEYFNEVHLPVEKPAKAFALVTAGPGLTNIVTALAGAYLESRELLVIGGQVKVADLARSQVRQRGIQEIDGVAIAKPVTERSELIETVLDRAAFAELTYSGRHGRKGPVFLEIPLDIQGAQVDEAAVNTPVPAFTPEFQPIQPAALADLVARVQSATRPVFLLGAGIDRDTAAALEQQLAEAGVPVMLTWNAFDRLGADHVMYFGRPNTWGMRYANILLQQGDLLVALGTRLSLQQSGFNWQQFIPGGEIVHVDCDPAELAKGHPGIAVSLCADANAVLRSLLAQPLGEHGAWLDFCREVRSAIPLVEPVNQTGAGYLSPYVFAEKLSDLATADDLVIPCSSGSAFTVMMQTFAQKLGQRTVTNKGLASMGYGLSGAIGAAFAGDGRRTILVEGDGGFTQNLQELGTVHTNNLNLKIFLFDDNGYASIRMTQRNYFGGRYVGCDTETGLGIPKWELLFPAYDIPVMRIGPGFESDPVFLAAFDTPGAHAFLVHIDPTQTYFPKITSRITESGSMESNPLHRMTPDLDEDTAAKVFRYLPVCSRMSDAASNPRPKTPILPLTSVRIFAALYVVLLHSFLWTHRLDTATWPGRLIRNGYTAVGFFFTLSGFILAYVYLNTDHPFDRRAFWTSRFARAYPLLFASLLLDFPRVIVAGIHQHGILRGLRNSLLALASESLLLQSLYGTFRKLNAPSWSLSAEAFFYLLFPVLAFRVWRWKRGKALAGFVLLWLCALATPVLVTIRHPNLFVEVDTSLLQISVELMPIFRIFEFLAGIALCAIQQSVIAQLDPRTRSRFGWLALAAAALLFFEAIDFSTHIPLLVMSDGFLLPVYGLTILGLVNLRGWLQQLLSHRLFVLLGEASYAVYLLHGPLYDYCSAVHPMNTPVVWAVYLTLVMGLSVASFLLLERPVRRMILDRAAIRPAVTLRQEATVPG